MTQDMVQEYGKHANNLRHVFRFLTTAAAQANNPTCPGAYTVATAVESPLRIVQTVAVTAPVFKDRWNVLDGRQRL